MLVAAILTAAGSGTRLGSDLPKGLVSLAGEPLVCHAARRLRAAGVDELVVTCPPGRVDEVRERLAERGVEATVVEGGPSRQRSVALAVQALGPCDAVLVHDAARALASVDLIQRVIGMLAAGAVAVIPGLPVIDTIKRVVADRVAQTLDRAELVTVQTPQGFARDLLADVHERGAALGDSEASAVSDDAGLVERLTEQQVTVVTGEDRAMKITTATDLATAEAMLASQVWS